MTCKLKQYTFFFLLLVFGIAMYAELSGCASNPTRDPLKTVDKQTLTTMVKQLYKAIDSKNYSVEGGIRVLKPYLSKYQVCIPGFSTMVPYDERYLYIYCVYDSVETPPRVLSFRFQLPVQLSKQLRVKDISEMFSNWRAQNVIDETDSTTTRIFNAGVPNLNIGLATQAVPGKKDSLITGITVYR